MAVAIERVLDRVDNSGMPVAEIAADGLAREVEHPRSVAERELHALGRDHVHEAVLLGRDVLVQVVASIPRLEELGRRSLGGFAHVPPFRRPGRRGRSRTGLLSGHRLSVIGYILRPRAGANRSS